MKTSDLGQRIYDVIKEEVDAIYPQFMKRVNDIDLNYFEGVICDSEHLPEELNFEIRDKVLDDIKQYAMQLLEGSNIKTRLEVICKDIDSAQSSEVSDYIKDLIHSYVYTHSVLNGSSHYSEEELHKLYTEAKKRDLWERIAQTNKDDVIKFHHALMDKTYEQCKDVMYGCLESFLGTIDMNPVETKVTDSKEKGEEQTYRCNDCGNTIYRHEVFCSKCGKKLDRFDFEDDK
jgi:hypothetical protein